MKNANFPCAANQYLAEHINLINNSFQQLLGYSLITTERAENDLATQLFHAPFVLLSHDSAADPVFNYANAAGLALFELNWQELITLPSRLSAEPVHQTERARLLVQVTEKGLIDDYQGIRISKTGKRFHIHSAIIWNLTDSAGVYQGQAACFSQWRFL